jgi:hypothetical protein
MLSKKGNTEGIHKACMLRWKLETILIDDDLNENEQGIGRESKNDPMLESPVVVTISKKRPWHEKDRSNKTNREYESNDMQCQGV